MNEPEAWPRTNVAVKRSEVASWLSASSDVLGACVRQWLPRYPTLAAMIVMKKQKAISDLQ